MYYSWWTLVFPAVTLSLLLLYYIYFARASRPLSGTTEWITRMITPKKMTDGVKLHRLSGMDVVPILIIAILGAGLNYFMLGDDAAPQSFVRIRKDEYVTVTFDEPTEITGIMYYTGMWHGDYKLEFSEDGENYTEQLNSNGEASMNQSHANVFKWMYAELQAESCTIKSLRISTTAAKLEMGEMAIYDSHGKVMKTSKFTASHPELFDEQELIPDSPSFMNSMYFDEIYHGRTAYEHLNDYTPYEITHPPLGKLIIMVGLEIFGMTPFGWRFMGATFGWIMLVVMYIFLKNMFGKTGAAFCGTLLFTFDFMRFTQTRIGTIDTYGVMFILLAYYFMYRYIAQPHDTKFGKTLWPLLFSGLFFGVGCACKWIVAYAGVGLAIIYLIHQILRIRHMVRNGTGGIGGYIVGTLLFSVLFFVIIPAVIYVLSYIPYGINKGMSVSGGMLTDPDYYKVILDNQEYMFSYHSGLDSTHPYSSVWWQWVCDIRPILYYRKYFDDGTKSAIAAFGNPVVWWGGLMAMVCMAVRFIKYRDGRALFILIGYLVQLIPWIIITRVVFIYHYFPCVIFMVMAQTYVFSILLDRKYGSYKLSVAGYTAGAGALFAAFYPVTSGLPASEIFTRLYLRWIPNMWPF